jgi:GNAT superfamily N-acetyltransferase
MVQAEPDLRVTLNEETNSKNEIAQQRLIRLGFKEVRRFWEMEIVQTEAPPEPVWPAGIEIRPFEPEEHAYEVWQMMDTAFKDHYGHVPGNFERWKHRRLERSNFDASLWIVAWANGQPVGGAFNNVEGDHGFVGTLGNLRAWRGKGLGMALLRAAFGEFWRRGMPRVTLGADSQNLTGAVKLYKKAGMHVAHENISFEKELRPGREISTQALTE